MPLFPDNVVNVNNPSRPIQLVLLRHGQSIWNQDRHFTGWSDVALSEKGKEEAKRAAHLLKQANFSFDLCYSSVLERAVDTLNIIRAEMGLERTPLIQDWRLNERHYGALEGLQRWEAIKKFGIWPVLACQIFYKAMPPILELNDLRFPGNQLRYQSINQQLLPQTESMEQTLARVYPCWQNDILPEIKRGKRILIVSHRNLLRTLVMQLNHLSPWHVMKLSIATGKPLCFELDDQLNSIRSYYLQ